MTTRSFPVKDSDQVYWVYETDALGIELPELQSGKPEFVSDKLISIVSDRTKPVTDVIIAIHGWATAQQSDESLIVYDELFAGIMQDFRDNPAADTRNFLLIGVHWPSAVGAGRADELIDDEATFEDNLQRMNAMKERLRKTDPPAAGKMEKLLDTVQTSAAAAPDGVFESSLVKKVEGVKKQLAVPTAAVESDDEDELSAAAEAASELRIVPDPENQFYKFTSFLLSRVLRPLETMIFGQFLERSENLGEHGLHKLLALLQEYGPAATRFHLISHSLGAPALCRALVGRDGRPYLLRRKVHSATLLQGAIGSHTLGRGNKFERMSCELCPVAGPIVVTTSQTDAALDFYRFFHDFPLGHHGAVDVKDMPVSVREVEAVGGDNKFRPGELYNMIADKYIDNVDNTFAGSHVDIFGKEIMRMIRQAMEVPIQPVKYALPTSLSKEFFKERLNVDVDVDTLAATPGQEKTGEDKGWGCVLA